MALLNKRAQLNLLNILHPSRSIAHDFNQGQYLKW